jgi:hypothetical protein
VAVSWQSVRYPDFPGQCKPGCAHLEDFPHLVLRTAQACTLVGLDQRPLDQLGLGCHGGENFGVVGLRQTAFLGIGALEAQPLLRRDAGIAIDLRELGGARRVLEIFDNSDLDTWGLLKNRQSLARGAANGVVPDGCFHGSSPREIIRI